MVIAIEASRSDGGSWGGSFSTNPNPTRASGSCSGGGAGSGGAPAPCSGITFAGGGFRTISYLGQLLYLEKRGMIQRGKTRFYGASLGAMFACGLVFGEQYPSTRAKIMQGLLEYCCAVHDDWLTMWGLCGTYAKDLLESSLPDDISAANGRIFVSVTKLLPLPHNELISHFDDKQDLISALLASQFIPGWTHGPYAYHMFRGTPCVDGGLFDNVPTPTTGGDLVKRQRNSVANPSASLSAPTLRAADRHFVMRDPDAPLIQVFRPPLHGSAEDVIREEVRRGYFKAREAVKKQANVGA